MEKEEAGKSDFKKIVKIKNDMKLHKTDPGKLRDLNKELENVSNIFETTTDHRILFLTHLYSISNFPNVKEKLKILKLLLSKKSDYNFIKKVKIIFLKIYCKGY